MTFVDTQKIGYLLNALRHEADWDVVSSSITLAQIKGTITFREACEELKVRCETKRVHDLLDRPIKGRKVQGLVTQAHDTDAKDDNTPVSDHAIKAFISTVSKRLNLDGGGSPASDGEESKKIVMISLPFLFAVSTIIRWFLPRSSLSNFETVMTMRPITSRHN